MLRPQNGLSKPSCDHVFQPAMKFDAKEPSNKGIECGMTSSFDVGWSVLGRIGQVQVT